MTSKFTPPRIACSYPESHFANSKFEFIETQVIHIIFLLFHLKDYFPNLIHIIDTSVQG